jgi:hypothetical protein
MLGDVDAVDGKLGDVLAAVLDLEPAGLSCDALARRTNRRKAHVLATLRSDSRFEHRGQRRGSRWAVVARGPRRAPPERQGTTDSRRLDVLLPPTAGDAHKATASA